MNSIITIDPVWRDAPPFQIYRNPDSKVRAQMIAQSSRRGFRFVLSGNGDLFVGDSWEFTHHDSHTRLKSLYGSNAVWMGEIVFAGPHFPVAYDQILNPMIAEDDPQNRFGARHQSILPHTTAEFTTQPPVCLIRLSHYPYRSRGLLDQSVNWRRFIIGSLRLPAIDPLEGFDANLPVDASSRYLVLLHNDGHLYFFPKDHDIHEAAVALSKAEAKLFKGYHTTSETIIGMRLGGNSNSEIEFSDATHPMAFLRHNRNFIKCFSGVDLEIIDQRHVAV